MPARLVLFAVLVAAGTALSEAQAPAPPANPASPPAADNAQQPDAATMALGLTVFKTTARCQFCHGWDGAGNASEYGGNAPSLRATQLTRDQIAETVRCGRPGAGMPYHARTAYTDGSCNGLTAADLGDEMPPAPLGYLSDRQINAVADYVAYYLKGRGAPTYQECVDFYASKSRVCDSFRDQAQQ